MAAADVQSNPITEQISPGAAETPQSVSAETLRRMLVPVLAYGNNETAAYGLDMKYNLSWAPHHLGTW